MLKNILFLMCTEKKSVVFYIFLLQDTLSSEEISVETMCSVLEVSPTADVNTAQIVHHLQGSYMFRLKLLT